MKKSRGSKMPKGKKSSRRPPRRGTPAISKDSPLDQPQHSEDIVMDPVPITQIPFEDIYSQPETEPTGSEGIFGELIVDLDKIIHQQSENLVPQEKLPTNEEEIRESESNPETRVTNSDTVDSFEKELDNISTELRVEGHETSPNETNPDEFLRKRRRVDPYEGADPRAKRPCDFPISVGPPRRTPNIPPPRMTRTAKRKQKEVDDDWENSKECQNERSKSPRKFTSKEKGKQTAEIDVETTLPTPDLPQPLNNQFQDKASSNMWHKTSQRKIIPQKLVNLENLKDGEHIIELLAQGKLLDTVTKIEPFEEKMIHEFYSNLKKESSVSSSPLYEKIYLRGNYYDFSPDVINTCYNTYEQDYQFNHNGDIIAQEITAGNVVLEKKKIKAACLTSKYAILQKIALANWMPSLHENTVKWSLAELLYKVGKKIKISYGELVHQQIMNLAEIKSPKASLIFPNLIQTILTKQGLKTTKKNLQQIKTLNVSVKLKKGFHQNDLKTTSPEDDPMNTDMLQKYFQKRLNELNTSERYIKQRQLEIQEEKVEVLKWLTALGANNKEEPDKKAEKSQEVNADEEESEGETEKSQEDDAENQEGSQEEEQAVGTPEATSSDSD
ncbi:PREDICTED: uncharacterized protein LOC109163048 [Ipomoea nil]|uniref:uncharacterized protein LOC109163048 n=1 Tax=Ipomoea nil TaxID=35883 RepID=UPI0009013FB1|nr:PREDICTED: uncharacterized protein LOC109163048 [Ipomoea nil]